MKVAKVNTINDAWQGQARRRRPPRHDRKTWKKAVCPADRRIPRPSSSSRAWYKKRKECKQMSIKTFKPTTPSRRHMTVSGFDGIDKHAKPEAQPDGGPEEERWPQQLRPHHRPPSRRRQQAGSTASSTSSATRWIWTPLSCAWSTIPTAAPTSRWSQYEDGEKRYILAPVGLNAGDKVRLLRRCRHQARQLPAHRQHPCGYRDPQRGDAPRQGRPAGPLRRRLRPADG